MHRVTISYFSSDSVAMEVFDPRLQKELEAEVSKFDKAPPTPNGPGPSVPPFLARIHIEKGDGTHETINVDRICMQAYVEGKGWYDVKKEAAPVVSGLVNVLRTVPGQ